MLEDVEAVANLFAELRPEIVIHLAAQAGVRASLDTPRAFVDANVEGSFNVFEACRAHPPRHLLAASTSSVYAANRVVPFRETDPVLHPTTLYAATKLAMEAMAHAYAHLFGLPTTVFRFFTVYGPWGRPDMAPFRFVERIAAGEPIDVHNDGAMERDFTYVEDLVEAVVRLVGAVPPPVAERPPGAGTAGDSLSPIAPYRVVNVGLGQPVKLLDFIGAIERALDRRAVRNLRAMHPGEAVRTFANSDLLESLTGYRPSTQVETGIERFVAWYRAWHADAAPAAAAG